MITRDWLLSRTALDEQLKQPLAYDKAGLWPTTYSVRYDEGKDEYTGRPRWFHGTASILTVRHLWYGVDRDEQ